MKSKKTKQPRILSSIITEIFLYKNTTRFCITKTYSDDTIEEVEKFANETNKITFNISDMTSTSAGITIYNFKQYDYYK